MSTPVRVRIGPSPTGDPHVGTAYIALFNYVLAKQTGGQFILRIEDTDRTRSRPEWETMLVDALRWLGLEWDEGPDVGGPHGPYRQSERGAIYSEHAQMLLNSGAAYRCFCTAERLAALRAEQREKKLNFGYDGCCRALDEATVQAKMAAGEAHVVRLRVPDAGVTVFDDRLRGEVSIDNGQIDDQVILKSDGMPTYHLANVVDDHLMGMTHVIRAEEWITSTPKHVLLYRAFDWEAPTFVHMPLLRNADKSKISKRKNPVSLNYYREAGYLPAAMLNYLGMMGWTLPDGREQFSVDDMVSHFDFDRMSLGGPVFDVAKLTWLNGLYVRDRSAADLVAAWRAQVFTEDKLLKVAELLHKRVDKLEDVITQAAFFFCGDLNYDATALGLMVPKTRSGAEMAKAFKALAEAIDAMPAVDEASIEAAMRGLCEQLTWKTKELFMPVRVAVTGSKATPGLFESMAVLGKERCRRRLRLAAEAVRKA